jgi:ring-1,2-phenylacetyl-CoA epoxidase subunit PaaB
MPPIPSSRIQAARDVYTRRGEGNSIWVVPSPEIAASDPVASKNFEPAEDKVYRHPTFYDIPDEVGHM